MSAANPTPRGQGRDFPGFHSVPRPLPPALRGTRVLVAGVTGQVGQGLLEACGVFADDAPVLLPVVRRRSRSRAAGPAVERQLVGEVSEPMWGLSEADLASLGEVDAVLNLAGVTDWTASHAELDRVNALGAVRGLELSATLSERQRRPVPYVYASSVFVAGLTGGSVPEDLLPPLADRTPYELSKWTAERALISRARRDGHPVVVARIGGVVGSSLTGGTTRRSSLYQLVSRREEERAPRVLPAQRGARVDILPRDVIGESLLRILGHGRSEGFTGWRCGVVAQVAAGERAPTLAALLAQLEAMDTGSRYRVPRLVPASPGMMHTLTRVGARYVRLSRQAANRLHGLRYVAIDRVFERGRFARLTDGWLPAVPLETTLSVTFGLTPADPPAPTAELPLGRFQ